MLLALAALCGSASTPDRVLMLSRHGLRRQFPSAAFDFNLYAPGKAFATDDAAWGSGQQAWGQENVLTLHGYEAVKLMGEYQGKRYASLLADCRGVPAAEPFLYAEPDVQRDVKTAEAFFIGLGCNASWKQDAEIEYLIDQGSKPRGERGECTLGSQVEVEGRIGGQQGIKEYERLLAPELEQLGEVLGCCAPALCENTTGKCTLADLPSAWDAEHWYTTFSGPLYAAKYFAEWFELTMLNGMEFAWGKLSIAEVMKLTRFVTLYREFEFDALAAKPYGSALVTHLVATLEQWAKGADSIPAGALSHSEQSKLVYYAAHDTNLLYVGELLGLKWLSSGWNPNHTPPGGALVFELFSPENAANPTGVWSVRAFFDVQTPEQMRSLSALSEANPPSRAPITIPGCSDGEHGLLCPLEKLVHIAKTQVAPECITPDALRKYASSERIDFEALVSDVKAARSWFVTNAGRLNLMKWLLILCLNALALLLLIRIQWPLCFVRMFRLDATHGLKAPQRYSGSDDPMHDLEVETFPREFAPHATLEAQSPREEKFAPHATLEAQSPREDSPQWAPVHEREADAFSQVSVSKEKYGSTKTARHDDNLNMDD